MSKNVPAMAALWYNKDATSEGNEDIIREKIFKGQLSIEDFLNGIRAK